MSARKIKDRTAQDLIETYNSYHDAIETVQCFGTKDLIKRDIIEAELLRRGFELRFEPKWELIVKEED